ncbi:thioredoxin domain-containing protein [Halobacteriales archaeon QS_6_71_20]|nr:MAG: thioredoxin domain-containing protein [Halobacteriales archaeon QS_6_71_20]
MTDETRVEWREWGPEAFAAAERSGTPVLLFLTANWCDDCRRMLAETFGEPQIAANVGDAFVPVTVDVDRHPRVRERYNMGGFPSVVFATPDGDLLTGATYLGPDGFREVLERVRETYEERGEEAGRVPRALADDDTPAGAVTPAIEKHLAGQLDAQWDGEFAGWGDDAKFPLPRTVEFALKRDRRRATRTLDAIERNLVDDDGGVFRYAAARDWSRPAREKLLVDNAGVLRAFANAYLYTGDESYREVAEGVRRFLDTELWAGLAYGASVGPDGERVDLSAYAGGNALAADALLTLAAYTDDDRARRSAENALAYLRETLVDDDGTVRHADGEAAGTDLLEDVGRVVAAFCRAESVLGEGVDVARAVADRAVDVLGDEPAFRDGPAAGPGLLDRPLRPIDSGVEFAGALLDLAALTGEAAYRERAEAAVGAFAGATERMGAQVAVYGSVAARLTRDPLVVDVGAPVGSDLHRAALRVADHEAVVVPDSDRAPTGTAVLRERDAEPAPTPEALMTRVADHAG